MTKPKIYRWPGVSRHYKGKVADWTAVPLYNNDHAKCMARMEALRYSPWRKRPAQQRSGIEFPACQAKRAEARWKIDRRACSKYLPLLYNMNTMTQEKLTEILRALHDGLAALLGERLEAVYLYGSQARGDARLDSDIDILIVIRGDFDYFEMIERTSHLTAKISLENDTVISSVFVKKEDFESRRTPLLINIRREGVLL